MVQGERLSRITLKDDMRKGFQQGKIVQQDFFSFIFVDFLILQCLCHCIQCIMNMLQIELERNSSVLSFQQSFQQGEIVQQEFVF